uniref:Uncharacterized protein n=1 Tax=Aegilops tauschii subsp. strangulata TaxID=200361 RepID=A0A453NYR9_AEGTS
SSRRCSWYHKSMRPSEIQSRARAHQELPPSTSNILDRLRHYYLMDALHIRRMCAAWDFVEFGWQVALAGEAVWLVTRFSLRPEDQWTWSLHLIFQVLAFKACLWGRGGLFTCNYCFIFSRPIRWFLESAVICICRALYMNCLESV